MASNTTHLTDTLDLETQAPDTGDTGYDWTQDRALPEPRDLPRPHYPLSDTGNAERFLDRYGHEVRFVPERDCWIVWDGQHWRWDDHGGMVRALVIETMKHCAVNEPKPTSESGIGRHLKNATNNRSINNCLSIAKGQRITVLEELDHDPFLLGVANGTLDLTTGLLQPPRRDDLITRPLDLTYREGAHRDKGTRWLSTVEEVLPDDEVRDFFQRCAGYSLTGSIREQVMFMLYGRGSNGKSLLLNAMRHVLGPLARTTRDKTVLGRSDEHAQALARLADARMVMATESDGPSARLREGVVKSITGGEPVAANYMRQNTFEHEATYKLWFATNHLPRVAGNDYGIWRRIVPVPFSQTVSGEKDDDGLSAALRSQRHGRVIGGHGNRHGKHDSAVIPKLENTPPSQLVREASRQSQQISDN